MVSWCHGFEPRNRTCTIRVGRIPPEIVFAVGLDALHVRVNKQAHISVVDDLKCKGLAARVKRGPSFFGRQRDGDRRS